METQRAEYGRLVQHPPRRGKTAHGGIPDRAAIVRALVDIYAGPAWHGPSVLQSLRGVDAVAAARRPSANRNSIWELVLHLAYTRHRLLLRMGASEGRFPRPLRAPWWPRPGADAGEDAWHEALALLDAYQERLLAAVAGASPAALRRVRRGRRETIAHELLGVAFHDAYHAGQIRLLALSFASAAGA